MALTPDQMDAVVRRTVALYDDAERLLLDRIAKSLAEGLDAPDWAAKKLIEVQMVQARLRRDLNLLAGKAAAEISTGIGEAYNAGQITAVGQLGRVVDGGSPVNPFVSQAAVALARDTVAGITGQHARVLRSVGDVYRNVIAEVVGVQLAGATNQRELAGRALAKFADKGVTGFVDSAGRRWSMSAYTEMAMRTATHNASEVGHTERLQAEGHDLVIVSDHAQECPDCARWEGKVLSLSGTYEKGHPQKQRDGGVRVMIAGTLAQAKQDGYGHPGCRHRVVAFFPGVTKIPERQGDPGDYLLRQEQRHLERGVKRWRRREAAALSPAEAKLARAKAREWGERLRAHEAAHGLKRQPWRTSAGGTRQLPPLPDYVAKAKPARVVPTADAADALYRQAGEWETRVVAAGEKARDEAFAKDMAAWRAGGPPPPTDRLDPVEAWKLYKGWPAFHRGLRGARELTDKERGQIGALDEFFDLYGVRPAKPMLVTRHTSAGDGFDPAKLAPGSRFVDRSYVSTSADPLRAKAFGDWRMDIEVPTNVKVVFGMVEDREIILPRGLTFEVLGRDDAAKVLRLKVVRKAADRSLPTPADAVAKVAKVAKAATVKKARKTFGKITPGLRASTYDQPMETFKWVGYSDEWVEMARSALRAMDSIGVLPEGVDFLGDETGRRRNGAYVTGTEQVLLAKSANGNTIVHEVGHLIDCLFFSGRGYSSRNRTTKAWRDWFDTVSETAKMKQIAEAGRTGRISKEWAAYASQDIEMWARSFAQWVAVRSEDPALLAEIRKAQKGEGPGGSIYMVWSDEDFAPLLPLIDKLMGSVSLAKPAGYAGGG